MSVEEYIYTQKDFLIITTKNQENQKTTGDWLVYPTNNLYNCKLIKRGETVEISIENRKIHHSRHV